MKKAILVSALLALVTSTWAQQQAAPQQRQPQQQAPPAAPGAQSTSPVAKQPQPKSQAEIQALQAMFQAPDTDSRIKAADEFIAKFADSDFKALANMVLAESYGQKGDNDKRIIYAERALEADPKSYMSMLMLANAIAGGTREHDLDREEKLGRAEKYAHDAMDIVKAAPRPRPDITDEQWAQAKKEFEAQGHEALGMVAMVRKKHDVAIQEFTTAAGQTANPESTAPIRLGQAYAAAGKLDEAIAQFDKVIANPATPAQFKQYAQAQRAAALQKKGGAAAPATPPAGTAAPAAGTQPAPAPAPAPAQPKP